MPNTKDCVVLIPVYKSLNAVEQTIIKQAIRMTPGFDKVFVMPRRLVLDESFKDFADVPVERFSDSFFTSIMGYNKLMLDVNFYKRFSHYTYLLIHQLDVYLFKPDLPYWCNQDYDYIGAPWLKPQKMDKLGLYSTVPYLIPPFVLKRLRQRMKIYNSVGNGGLSLRKTDTFIRILESANNTRVVNAYLSRQKLRISIYNEDVFWSLEGPRLCPEFNKPGWKKAMYFSLEKNPSFGYSLMNNQLPFGCHKPWVHEPDFWKEHIPFITS